MVGDKAGAVTIMATGKKDNRAAGQQARLDVEVFDAARLQGLSTQTPAQLVLAMDDSELRLLGGYGQDVMLETRPTELKVDSDQPLFIDRNGGKISPLELGDVSLLATVTVATLT